MALTCFLAFLFATLSPDTNRKQTDSLVLSVKNFGAKGDAAKHDDATINTGSQVLYSATTVLTASDIGKTVFVLDACRNGLGRSTLEAIVDSVPTPHTASFRLDRSTYSKRGITCDLVGGVKNAVWVIGTDDTVAINQAISAAGKSAAVQHVQLDFPSDTGGYLVAPQDRRKKYPSSLVANVSNVTFSGTDTWIYNSGAWSKQQGGVVRGSAWAVGTDLREYHSLTWRHLNIDGMTSGNTDKGNVGTNELSGDGWDISNKGIEIVPDIKSSKIIIDCCKILNFKGELIYQGGPYGGSLVVINSVLQNSNADGISASSAEQTITGNQFENLGNACIENGVESTTVSYLIVNNRCIRGARSGIVLVAVSNRSITHKITIEKNFIENCGTSQNGGSGGIRFAFQQPIHTAISDVTLRDNQLTDNVNGITIDGLVRSKIEHNHCLADKASYVVSCIDLVGTQSQYGYLDSVTIDQNDLSRTQNAKQKNFTASPLQLISTTPVRYKNVVVAHNTWNEPRRGLIVNDQHGLSKQWSMLADGAILFYGNQWLDSATDFPYNPQRLTRQNSAIIPVADLVAAQSAPPAPDTVTIRADPKIPDRCEIVVRNVGQLPLTFASDAALSLAAPVRLEKGQELRFEYSARIGKWALPAQIGRPLPGPR